MRENAKLKGQTVLVLGIAKSGNAVSRLLLKYGAKVVVNDKNIIEPNSLGDELAKLGCEVYGGGHPVDLFEKYTFDMVVKNPGIPYHNVMIEEALRLGIPVRTEIEIAYLVCEAPIIGITGSNGKTTTTTLIFEMLKAGHKNPLIAGNIGEVASEVVQNAGKDQVMVTELSSFQLLGTEKFCPQIAVLLNLFDAHLDYHGTKEEYIRAKMRIFANQSKKEYAVINMDDPTVASLCAQIPATIVPFSTKQVEESGAYLADGAIFFQGEKIIDIGKIVLPGAHNLENILAAICAVKIYGASNEAIVKVLTTFRGVEHRLQFVKEWKGRKFYNDSKATNILATQKAIAAFSTPLILIAGGLDRGNYFDALVEGLGHVKALITYGETKEKLKMAGEAAKVSDIQMVENLTEAITEAVARSVEGDTILLSPACASWDQFKTFEQRGHMFVQLVNTLE